MIAAEPLMTPSPASSEADSPASIRPVAGRASLLVAMAITLPATAALLAGVLVLVNQPDWWRALLPATVIGLLAAGISLVPLLWGMQRGPHKAVLAFFVAGGLRAGISLGGGLLAVHVGGYPLRPTLLLVVAYYFAALGVEAAVLARSMWRMKL